MRTHPSATTDVILIGAGIMSATLGALLQQLNPSIRIQVFERLDTAAAESSDAWNNAGTGHAAFCELNYTPQREDGSIDISKAIKISEAFEVSRQFWAYLVSQRIIVPPQSFIRAIPHLSFVWGEANVSFLRKRFEALQSSPLFKEMEYTEFPEAIRDWAPLIMEGREGSTPVAATRMDMGTDVNFGALTRCLFEYLKNLPGINLHFGAEVRDLEQRNGLWHVEVKDEQTGERTTAIAPFVFIGAGGGSLPLLLQSGIREARGYGGFPVSGQWLRCTNEEVIQQHHGKVYGLASVGAPPMSVPHLDTRWIKGKKELLFGPYAGFTTKFLRHGSVMDLFKSIRFNNLRPMVAAGISNLPLTKYLIEQVRQTEEDRLEALRAYFPGAKAEDWELEVAGYRVQVIKSDEEKGGVLEFGTEVVSANDGSIAALLGASPGASTAVSIMIDLLGRCFPDEIKGWEEKLKEMIPSYGKKLSSDEALLQHVRAHTSSVLQIR